MRGINHALLGCYTILFKAVGNLCKVVAEIVCNPKRAESFEIPLIKIRSVLVSQLAILCGIQTSNHIRIYRLKYSETDPSYSNAQKVPVL